MNDDDKARWKAEAEQLKDDLNHREKELKVRKVPIRLRSSNKSASTKKAPPSSLDQSSNDDFLRRQLGI